jgi:hypothetical protein
MSFELIETKTLSSAAASIEFTSIPQDGTDLVIFVSLRSTGSTDGDVSLRFNGSTSGYSYRGLFGTGSSTGSSSGFYGSDEGYATLWSPGSTTSNTFGNGLIYIPNYTGSQNKSYSGDAVYENNATTAFQLIIAGLWSNTAAITSVTFTGAGDTGTFATGSTISLYKVTKGSDGSTVVS